jgi:hypothetical protein
MLDHTGTNLSMSSLWELTYLASSPHPSQTREAQFSDQVIARQYGLRFEMPEDKGIHSRVVFQRKAQGCV